MQDKKAIIDHIRKQLEDFKPEASREKIGKVLEVADGIVRLDGLSSCMSQEMIDFGNNIFGVALNLEDGVVGAMILGEYSHIKEGDTAKSTGKILSVPVSESLVGRVVDPLGKALDGKGAISAKKYYPIEKI